MTHGRRVSALAPRTQRLARAAVRIGLGVLLGAGPALAQTPPAPSTMPGGMAPATQSSVAPPTPEGYRLQHGDVLDIKFFYNTELNETVPVRTDGRIALQLVGEVDIAGRTPAEVRDELIRRYGTTLKQPELVVIVREMAPRRVYVGGEVNAPGLLRMAGRLTLLQGIFEAGGIKRSGRVGSVVLLRYQGTSQPQFLTVDLKLALTRGDPRADILLQPYDIVWVPKTRIAKMNDFVDQYFRQIVPVPLTLGISYIFGGLTP